MEQERSHSDYILRDIIEAFSEEDSKEAEELRIDASILSFIYDVDYENVLDMTWGEYLELYTVPEHPTVAAPRGWDKVWYGEAAFKEVAMTE